MRSQRTAVTLIELLVVLGIIGILLGMLLPAVFSARERAREMVCQNNLHQINLATANYTQIYKRIPGPGSPDVVGGWAFGILPFIEQKNLFERVSPGTRISNAPSILMRQIPIFRCPVRSDLDEFIENEMDPAHYVLVPITVSDRKWFMIYDAPVTLKRPWASGPEMASDEILRSKGPHRGGFFSSNGFQQGIKFSLEGN